MSLDSDQTKYSAVEHLARQLSGTPVSGHEHRLPSETEEQAAKGTGL